MRRRLALCSLLGKAILLGFVIREDKLERELSKVGHGASRAAMLKRKKG